MIRLPLMAMLLATAACSEPSSLDAAAANAADTATAAPGAEAQASGARPAPDPTPTPTPTPTPGRSDPPPPAVAQESGDIALSQNLREAHATLDGAPVTGFEATGKCEGRIATATGGATFRWGEQGNLAARLTGRRQILALPAEAPDGRKLEYDQGDAGDRVTSGIGLLVDLCDG